jgi:hypothetical protein
MPWSLITIAVICIVIFFIFLKKKQDELKESFQKRFTGQKILYMDKYARIIAQESRGFSQTSGMGYLVLTSQELYFKLQLMHMEISIPISSLLSVGETRRMGGKNPLRTMLKVDFNTIDGKEDAIALIVKDLPRWKVEISNIMKKDNQDGEK